MKYRPDIDGIRGIACVIIVLFHAQQGCKGGFAALEMFFVLSGYLVTTQLMRAFEKGTWSFKTFYVRRVRRLFAALALMVAVTLAAGALLLLPRDFAELGRATVAQGVLCANVFFWSLSGYFEGESELKPLLHTWSLAVEEQFYLFYPPILWLLARQKRVLSGLVGLSLISFACSEWSVHYSRSAAYYLLPNRAWEILLGGILTFVPPRWPASRPARELLGLIGFGLLLGTSLKYHKEMPYPGAWAILPCLGTALLIVVNREEFTFVGRFLAWRPIVYLGLISYSWYLWHWPMLSFARYWALEPLHSNVRWFFVALGLLCAMASWRWVEGPLRTRQKLPDDRTFLRAVWSFAVLLLLAGAMVAWGHGLPGRLPASALGYANTEEPIWGPMLSLAEARAGHLTSLGTGKGRVDFVLWGDSHALMLKEAVSRRALERGLHCRAAFHGATLPLLGYVSTDLDALQEDSIPYNQAIVDYVQTEHVPRVLMVSSWDHYPKAGMVESLERTLHALQGCEVWMLQDVPRHQVNIPRALTRCALFGGDARPYACSLADYERQKQWFQENVQKRHPEIHTLDPTGIFYPDGPLCRIAANGQALYWDTNHLTRTGAEQLGPLLDRFLDSR